MSSPASGAKGKPAKGPSLSQLERSYIRTSADLANDLLALIRRTHAPGYRIVKTGISSLDRDLTIAPGMVTVLAARPGNGKSMILKVFAKSILADMMKRGEDARDERLVYITLEEGREKLAAQIGNFPHDFRTIMRGEIPPDKLEAAELAAMYVAKDLPHLLALAHPGLVEGQLAPPITPEGVIRFVTRSADEDGIRPRAILLDYLQLLDPDGPPSRHQNRAEMVGKASRGAKQLARAFDCPVVMAVQAGRDTDSQKVKIPRVADLQWASQIEQDADSVIGLWRPSVDCDIDGPPIDLNGRQFSVTDKLMLARILKARDDPSAGRTYGLNVDPVEFTAYPIDPMLAEPGGPPVSSRPGYQRGQGYSVPPAADDIPDTW